MTLQLAFDVAPARTVAVGDRVRVHPSYSPLRTNVRAGMTGVVVDVRASVLGVGWMCHPVAVAIDGLPHSYAFDDEDLEVIDG
jgi:hypothetical protein